MADEIKVEIKVDLSKSTLADWELVAKVGKGLGPDDIVAWVEFLDRVLVGGKNAFPMTALRDVILAVSAALAETANPKAPAA